MKNPSRNNNEWFLKFIDVENFKSYKGVSRIGPLRPFMAIVGPNGSGKSNLMDVISFVMGERTSTLRGKRLEQLIHGAHIGRPVATQAKVSAVFSRWGDDNPQEFFKFTRTIRGTSCDYAVNDEILNHQAYLEKLETLGINVKGKNFLVFQGAVEGVATKSPKERTFLLEEICGSGALKEDYEKFKSQVNEAENKLQQAYLKKKTINVEREGAKMELAEAKQYKDLQKQIANKELEMNLFKLHKIQQDIINMQSTELNNAETEDKLRNARENIVQDLKVTKKKRGELDRQLNLKKNIFFEKEKEKGIHRPKLIEHQQKQKHLEKKLKASTNSLEQAEQNKLHHEHDLQQLRRNLKEIQEKESLFVADQNERGIRNGVNITLRDSQIQKYWELKKQVIKETHADKKATDDLENKRNDEEDVCKSLNREGALLKTKLELAEYEITEKGKLADKVDATICELKEQLSTKNAEVQPLQEEILKANERIKVLQDELETISQNISYCKMDQRERAGLKRRQETIEALKKHFKGVHDRVMYVYKPRHDRYKVAIAKIMGKYINAIVVDSERTARQCVQYLREQTLEPEVFLSLDLLEVKPLRDRFRDQIPNVHLAFDILEFDSKFKKAILHCTKSTVICSDPDIASQIAGGEFFSGESTDAVSFDGTYFATSGIISGGQADLIRHTRTLDNNSMLAETEQKREAIKNELREALKTSRKCDALDYLNVELKGIRDRLKFAETDRKTYVTKLKTIAASKSKLEEELALVNNRCGEAETIKAATVQKLKEMQTKVNLVEDEVFGSFCKKINIRNIREYEDTDIRNEEDFNRKKDDFQNQIRTVQGQIDYEASETKSLQENITRWEYIVKALKVSLRSEEKDIISVERTIDRINKQLEEDQKEISEVKKSIETEAKDIKEKNASLAKYDQKLFEIQKTNAHLRNFVAQNQLKRHEIFKFCKLAGIDIPFFNGNLDDISIRDSGSSANSTRSETDSQIGIPGIPQKTLEIEEKLKVNFSCIGDRLKVNKDIQVNLDALEDELHNLQGQLGRIHAPNLKADQKWESVKSKLREQQSEFDMIRNNVNQARTGFENVKKERLDKFMKCFNKIAAETDTIYKELTQNPSAQAMLGLENPEEPYLDGVSYNCVAPGKRFQPMNNLSGGEKALAALALLFAMHSFEPSPFFVLDEVDAALDNANIHKVVRYIKKRSYKFQVIVISHKEEFYAHANGLIGVTPVFEETECIASDLFFLSLEEYQKHA